MFRGWQLVVPALVCAAAAPRAATAQDERAPRGGTIRGPEREAFRELNRRFEAYLASSPARTTPRKGGFFQDGKQLLEQLLDFHVRSRSELSALAYCRIPLVVTQLWKHISRATRAEKKWIGEEHGALTTYQEMCGRYSKVYKASDKYTKMVISAQAAPPRPPFPSVIPCRPADLLLGGYPSRAYLKRCAKYVRAEVRRLLRASRRQEKSRRYLRARASVDRAATLAPDSSTVRRRRATLKARMGDVTGALEEVEWWRRAYGDEAADRLRDHIVKQSAVSE